MLLLEEIPLALSCRNRCHVLGVDENVPSHSVVALEGKSSHVALLEEAPLLLSKSLFFWKHIFLAPCFVFLHILYIDLFGYGQVVQFLQGIRVFNLPLDPCVLLVSGLLLCRHEIQVSSIRKDVFDKKDLLS